MAGQDLGGRLNVIVEWQARDEQVRPVETGVVKEHVSNCEHSGLGLVASVWYEQHLFGLEQASQ